MTSWSVRVFVSPESTEASSASSRAPSRPAPGPGAEVHVTHVQVARRLDLKAGRTIGVAGHTCGSMGAAVSRAAGASAVGDRPRSSLLWQVRQGRSRLPEQAPARAGRWCEMCEFGECGEGVRVTQEPAAVYTIATYTGTAPGSGSDANVYITMYGHSGGMSPRVELSESSWVGSEGSSLRNLRRATKSTLCRFEIGSVDTFRVQVPPFGEPIKIRIGHDNSGLGPGWFLSKVVITRTEGGPSATWEFPCERWLDSRQDDRALEREIVADGHQDVGALGPVVAARASCGVGPSLVLSKQSAAAGLLAWSIRSTGSNSLICIGAAPADCKKLDSTPPDGAAWCITAASGMTSPLGSVQCRSGDRFRVVADLDHGALAVMRQASKQFRDDEVRGDRAPGGDKWQVVAMCDDKLSGKIRLCLCLWGGAEVELLQDDDQSFRQLLKAAQRRHHRRQLEALANATIGLRAADYTESAAAATITTTGAGAQASGSG